MNHDERMAHLGRPFPITYILPVKRWGGVQIIHDNQWMDDANAWRKRYRQEHGIEPEAVL